MKAIKKRLSILLAILMVFTGINPYAVSVKAQETTSVEILSEEASEAKTPDKEESLAESSQEEKQEADEGTLKEAEIKDENKEEIQEEVKEDAKEAELATRGGGAKEDAYTEDDFDYFEDHHLGENAISIRGLRESGKEKQKKNHDLVIPDEIDGRKVLDIDKKAFSNPNMDSAIQFKSIKLPKYLVKIGDSAFVGHAITEIEFPDTLEIIDINAFVGNELKEVLIPESVKVIGLTAFNYNKIVKLEIDNYEGQVKIDFGAFDNNGADGKTEITPTYLKVKEDLSWKVEDFTFVYEPLPGTEDEEGNPDVIYSLKGFSAKGLEKLNKNKNVVLPSKGEGDKTPLWIEDDAFKGHKIDSVEIPGNYTHIQLRAFKGCGLKKVVFNEGLVYANDCAFENNELTEIVFPSTFVYPSKASFKGNKLTSLTLPEICESIGPESFMNNQLTNVVMGSKVRNIYEKAFVNNKLTEVNIPKSLKTTGLKSDAFDSNPGMKNPLNPKENKVILWTPNRDNPNKLPSKGNYVVDPVPENYEYQADDFTYNSDNEVEGFSRKGSKKFDRMKDKPVVLPVKTDKQALVVGIAESGFENDAFDMTKIILPEGYKKIGDMAFMYSGIEDIDAPSTLEEIGDNSFLSSSKVVKIHVTKTVADRIKNTSSYWELVIDKEEQTPPQQEVWKVSDFTYGEMKAFRIEDDGTKTPIKLRAVTGFSDAGLEKLETEKDLLLPTLNDKDEKLEAVADRAFMGSPSEGKKRLKSLQIPEGYVLIGSMAFAFNKCGGDLILPESLQAVADSAFFRNEFNSLTTGKNLIDIPESMMRGNRLTSVTFKGDIESIGRLAFAENRLEEVKVPDSLKSIGEQAFTTNTGLDSYENKVVIRTASGNNPNNLPNKENYIIDPSNQGTDPNINYNVWTTEDFTYKDTTVTGFSAQGESKIRKNKNLVVPDKTPDGKDVSVIGTDAFRNLNYGYDIESVKLPDKVVKIEHYAFQFNSIEEVTLPRDLTTLEMGVFMMSGVQKVIWNQKLEYIDQACFFGNDLGKIELPASVHTIMDAAFRRCGLTEVKFAKGSKLKTIENLAFADNKLKGIDLPNGIEKIGPQAFGNNEAGIGNKFTELNVPASLKEIGFQAFLNNPGIKEYKAVVIHTPNKENPNVLVDDMGKTFVVDPKVEAKDEDKAKLEEAIKKAKQVEAQKLTEGFKEFFEGLLNDAEETYKDDTASKSKVLGLVRDLSWAVERAKLNKLMFDKEALNSQSANFDKEKWQNVEKAYKAAKQYLMTVGITDEKLDKLIGDLDIALKALAGQSGLEDADVYEGEAPVNKTHFIKPYDVKVKVWVKDGKIVFVKDNGTVCDDPSEEDPPNRGYFERAIGILSKYKGKAVDVVKNSVLGSEDLQINAISGATVSSKALHNAIKNALEKANLPSSEWKTSDFTYGDMDAVKTEDNGTETTIKLKAVTGFSEAGLEKLKTVKDLVLPTLNYKGDKLEAVANGAFSGDTLGENRLKSLKIPEGYILIGSGAFSLNGCGGDLILPDSLQAVGFAAFFRNEFTSLTTGKNLTKIPASMMLGNRLTKVTFKGDIESIGRIAFGENRLEEIKIPDSLKSIEEKAFIENTGSDQYDGKVVLRTVSGTNPQKLPDKENYIIDPSNQGTNPNINYNEWTTDDFTYDDIKVTGFSEQGEKKIKRNKKLVIPDKTSDGKEVSVIGKDAFRSLGTNYDISSVKLPDTVVEIEDYALQFNDIEQVTLPRELKTLGMGVFMVSKVKKVIWNKKLEYIGEGCFNGNDLGKIELPASVHTIMDAAFRRSGLTEVKFADGSKLKTIENLAFADNKLKGIDLPNRIEKIGPQAFGNKKAGIGNQFTELNVPASLKEIGFQAFANNPGVDKYKAVVIHTPDGKNPAGLVDDTGKTFVIDPEILATDKEKAQLKAQIDKADKVEVQKLTERFRSFFEGVLENAKATYNNPKASKSNVCGLAKDLSWAVNRAKLNKLMFEKEALGSNSNTFDKEKWEHVEEAYKSAEKYLMIINITDVKLKKLIDDLDIALKALTGQSGLEDAAVYEGESHIKKTHYIEPYNVKVKVWVKDGKIVFVKDNGTVCDDPSEEEQPNKGYFEQAIEILYKYKGKDVDVVKNNILGSSALNIKAISGATVSSHALHNAIKNALEKASVNPNPPSPNPPVNPDPQTPDPAPPTVDPIPDNGGFIPPSDSGSSSGGSSSGGGSIGSTAKTQSTIKDDETPLANLPEAQALILKSKKNMIKLTDKQLSDLITGKYTHMELTVGAVTVKLMPQDVKPFFKKGNGKNYLKISKLSKAEIKKLELDKKAPEKDAYKVELMISGQKVMNLKKKISVQMLYTGEIKKDTVTVLLAEAKKTIKAKYNKKTKMIEFKTNKIGTFLVLK